MKVVVAYDLGEEFVKDLQATFPTVEFLPAYTTQEQLRVVADAEVQFGELTREVYLAAKRLRWFHFIGIGFDHIVGNIPELVENEVVITNARGTHVIALADHVFAMILALAHNVPELLEDQRAHRWDKMKYYGRVRELAGTTIGLLAMGDIGRAVAQRAQGFGMDVYGVDILKMDPPPGVKEVWELDRLDDLIALSDWLVVTAPLTPQTRGIINRSRLERLKKGAAVIAVSRGGIVDEDALLDGLRSGHLGGAAFDIFAQEPLPTDNPLWDAPNMLISPHCSPDSLQMWVRRKQIFKENLRRFLAGEPMVNVCNKRAGY